MHRKTLCQFYDKNGQRFGNNILVNNPDSSEFPISTHYVQFPRAAITDDEYVLICWDGLPSGQIHAYPLARIYTLDGVSRREVFTLLEFDFANNRSGQFPDVDATPFGDFVISYNFNDLIINYPHGAIAARRVDSLGNYLSPAKIILDTADMGTYTRIPKVDAGPNGYIAIWSDERSGDSRNLMAQAFDYSDQPIGKNYRINGVFGSLSSPPDVNIEERQANWMHYDLDINSQGKVAVSWDDYRNYISASADMYAKLLRFDEIGFYISGDMNQDGIVTLADVISLVNYVFGKTMKPVPMWPCDVNADCKVTLVDVIYLVNHIFKGWTLQQGCA